MLQGVIPREFGLLSKFRVLDILRNSLTGSIPAEVGNCHDLSVLVLSNLDDPYTLHGVINGAAIHSERNLFEVSIPMKITVLPNLRIFWAPKAGIKGEFSLGWDCCNHLEMIYLSPNYFTGRANGVFASCKSLVCVDVSSNRLSEKLIKDHYIPNLAKLNAGKDTQFTVNACHPSPSFLSNSHQLNKGQTA